ncbi:MAG: hypothetical protein ABI647_06815 [Gemmatimonadota bacterium]
MPRAPAKAAAASPTKAIAGFLAKYTPEIAAFGRAARTGLRKQVPGGVELVYDNYNGLVFGYGPTARPSDAVLSLVLFPRWVTLCFLKGARMPDPKKLLRGSGTIVRHVRLVAASDLEKPDLRSLIGHAVIAASPPFPGQSRRQTVIRAVSAKQRPRRVET